MSDAIEAAEGLARAFHETYERLAPQYGYETRADTKSFDPTTPNGQLMMAVCAVLIRKVALTAYGAAKGGGVASVDGLPPGIRAWEYQDADGNWNLCVDSEHKLSLEREATFYGTGPVAFRPLFALTSPASGSGTREEIKGAVGRETEGWPAETDHVPSPASGERDAVIEECAKAEHHKLDTDAQVFFYEQDFYVLSNFSSFNLRWHGRMFPTSEHAYHWSRFALGWDLTDAAGMDAAPVAVRIMFAPSAHEAFKLAQEYRDLQHPNWGRDKIDTMRRILFAKAKQHEYVSRKLLATGDRELVEDSWRDDFWGWGPNRDGQNMLGKLWMEVRAALRMEGK